MVRCRALAVAGFLAALTTPGWAQLVTCAQTRPNAFIIEPGRALPVGPGSRVWLIGSDFQRKNPGFEGSVANEAFNPDAAQLAVLQQEASTAGIMLAVLPAAGTAATVCGAFDVSGLSRTGTGSPPPRAGAVTLDACLQKGREAENNLKATNRDGRFTLVVIGDQIGVCHLSRDYGVFGEPIYVGIVTAGVIGAVRFEPCAIAPDGPQLYVGSGSFPAIAMAADDARLVLAGPRRCYNEGVEIVVAISGQEQRFTLRQHKRYHATLQFGVLFATERPHSFGLRQDPDSNRIIDKGPIDQGPVYFASVVLYSLPRQLANLFGRRPFEGRDLVHDQSWLDRIGGAIGVGIERPGHQFAAGLSFELFNGANLLGTVYYVRANELAGVSVEQGFTGPADSIPLREVWKHELVAGLSLDLRYVTALFERR